MARTKPVGGSTETSAICRFGSLSPTDLLISSCASNCTFGSSVVLTVNPPLSSSGQLPGWQPGRCASSQFFTYCVNHGWLLCCCCGGYTNVAGPGASPVHESQMFWAAASSRCALVILPIWSISSSTCTRRWLATAAFTRGEYKLGAGITSASSAASESESCETGFLKYVCAAATRP